MKLLYRNWDPPKGGQDGLRSAASRDSERVRNAIVVRCGTRAALDRQERFRKRPDNSAPTSDCRGGAAPARPHVKAAQIDANDSTRRSSSEFAGASDPLPVTTGANISSGTHSFMGMRSTSSWSVRSSCSSAPGIGFWTPSPAAIECVLSFPGSFYCRCPSCRR
jgi:hypothetical protein